MENKLNVTIDKTTEVKCSCGNMTFTEVFMMRKVSRLLTGGPKDGLVPISVIACIKCGEPLPETVPAELTNNII